MDISATASSLFGSASADSIFAATKSATGTSDQQSARAIITAHNRSINRIRGYKLALTPTDKQKLVELKEKIQTIETKAGAGTVRQDELDDRLEMLNEADRIIGKPIVDVEADLQLAQFNNLRLALLEPKLDSATAKRVAFLERFRDSTEDQINENPDRHSLQLKLQSIVRQIGVLKPLRSTSQLSKAERKTYDAIVTLINDHAGVKIELTSQESNRVAALQSSIAQFQGSLGPDPSQQPTPQAVARAYTSLSRR